MPEFDFDAPQHHRLGLDRRREHGNVESEFAAEWCFQRVLDRHPIGAKQQVAFQRIVRRIRVLERLGHFKSGVQASG